MRNAAGQLSHCLHLLRMVEACLGGPAFRYLLPQQSIAGVQLMCALREIDAKLQGLAEIPARTAHRHDKGNKEHADHCGGGGAALLALQSKPDYQGEASRKY